MAKRIELTNGMSAIIDDEDFEKISKYKWYLSRDGYAVRNIPAKMNCGKRGKMHMHRVINNTPDNMFTDHVSGDRLDNRKKNLRDCSHGENQMNRNVFKNNKSGFKGVSKSFKKNKIYWRTQISNMKKKIAEKYFPFTDEGKLQAARWYNEMALKHFGEFAKLNEV